MAQLDATVVIDRVRQWQANPAVHPLTCGNDSTHRKLEPMVTAGAVVLRCADCGYEQTTIPPVVLLDPKR